MGEATGIDTRIARASAEIDADHGPLRERGVEVDDDAMRMGDQVPPMFFFRDRDGQRDGWPSNSAEEPARRSSRLPSAFEPEPLGGL